MAEFDRRYGAAFDWLGERKFFVDVIADCLEGESFGLAEGCDTYDRNCDVWALLVVSLPSTCCSVGHSATLKQTSLNRKRLTRKTSSDLLKHTRVTCGAGRKPVVMFAKVGFCLPKFLGIVGYMDKTRDWQRLAARARAARGSRSQTAIAKAGGPSHTTLGKIEHAKWRPKRGVDDTIEKLESVYRWKTGSVDAILDGGEPTPQNSVADSAPSHRIIEYDSQGRIVSEHAGEPVAIENVGSQLIKLIDSMIATEEQRELLQQIKVDIDQAQRTYTPMFDIPEVQSRYAELLLRFAIQAMKIAGVQDQQSSHDSEADPVARLGRAFSPNEVEDRNHGGEETG